MSNLKKGLVYYTSASFISVAINLLFVPIITNLMPVDQYGINSTYLAYFSILAIVVTGGVYTSIDKVLIENKFNRKEYIVSLELFVLFSSIVYMIIINIFKFDIERITGLSYLYFLYLGISLFFYITYSISLTYFRYYEKHFIVFLLLTLPTAFAQIFSLYFMIIIESKTAWTRIISYDLPMIFISVLCLIYFFKNKKIKFYSVHLKYALKISIVLIPSLLSQFILNQSDTIMLSRMTNFSVTAIYSLSYTISQVLSTIINRLAYAWTPHYFNLRSNETENNNISKEQIKIVLLGFICSCGFMICAKYLTVYFIKPEYEISTKLIPLLSIGMYFNFLYLFYYDVFYYENKGHYISYLSIFVAILNVILNYLFIPTFHFYATTFSTLLCYIILYFGSIILIGRKANIFNNKLMSLSGILICFLGVILFILP